MNKKLNVRKLCALGMLCALTVVLGFYATWRIGSTIKISLKFCPVFVAGYLFGPILGGIVGTVSDIASFIANPAGGFLPLITVAEFLYGFTYGIFFYKRKSGWVAPLVCVLFQAFILDGLFKSYALMLMVGGGYVPMLFSRIPGIAVNFVIQYVFLLILNSYMPQLKKIIKLC